MDKKNVKTETERVLLEHFLLYPEMEPQDAVKLLYQSEFGCAHLVLDVERAKTFLRDEWERTPRDCSHRRTDELGGGFIRAHLAPLSETELDDLASAFAASAVPAGSMEGFLSRIDALRTLAAAGEAPFSIEALEEYLSRYIALGCPAVHHSEQFRKAYSPAYRVIKKDMFD